jgi:membrane-bound ClpP family serine protease
MNDVRVHGLAMVRVAAALCLLLAFAALSIPRAQVAGLAL